MEKRFSDSNCKFSFSWMWSSRDNCLHGKWRKVTTKCFRCITVHTAAGREAIKNH